MSSPDIQERADQHGYPASFRVTDDLLQAASEMAGEELISLSAVYRRALKRDIERWRNSRALAHSPSDQIQKAQNAATKGSVGLQMRHSGEGL